MLDFDSETTLFVCNKWDEVNEDEEEAVLESITKRLVSEWQTLKPDQQLFKLSCKKENKRIRKKLQPSENYQNLVEGIKNVMPKSLEAKLIRHVRWQNYFVEKMLERIGSKIKLSKEAMGERELRRKEAEDRIYLLGEKLQKVKLSAFEELDKKYKSIAKEIVEHLNDVKDNVFIWNESELPKSKDMNCVAAKATELIREKIHDEINEWRLKRASGIKTEIEKIITDQFKMIDDNLNILQDCFGSFAENTTNRMTLWNILYSLSAYCHLGVGATIVTSPIVLLGFIGVAIFLGELPITCYYNYRNETFMEKYYKDKEGCMKEWAEKTLKEEVTELKIYTLMEPFKQTMKECIKYVCEKVVPKRIEADKICIEDGIKDRRSHLEILKQYNPIQRKCEMIIGKIEILSMEYFPMNPLAFKYIQQAQLRDQIGSGSFSIVHSATISIDNEDILAAVKTSKSPLDNLLAYQVVYEAVVMRRLQNHPNILKLYGLSFQHDAGKKFLQMCCEICEDSLYNIVMVKRTPAACGSIRRPEGCEGSWKFVLRIMDGLCSALGFIHGMGFVHRDLKLANILIKGEHSVRLSDFGLSKKEENITGTSTGTPLYMAPEVIMGNLYGTEADIYSLGMVIYELWYYRPVFTVPLQGDATKFEMIVNTQEELKDYVTVRNGRPDLDIPYRPPQKLKEIMKKCWNPTKEVRPSAKKVYDHLYAIKLS